MQDKQGVPASPSGHSATPEPVVSALRASVPNAEGLATIADVRIYVERRRAEWERAEAHWQGVDETERYAAHCAWSELDDLLYELSGDAFEKTGA